MNVVVLGIGIMSGNCEYFLNVILVEEGVKFDLDFLIYINVVMEDEIGDVVILFVLGLIWMKDLFVLLKENVKVNFVDDVWMVLV